MPQHSFQPHPYDENSRVWHNDHKPQFNLMGCICFILFLASCFWVIRAIDKSPRAFIWFLLFMYFLLWLCSRPVKRPRNILAVCDNEGLTLYDQNEIILHQWRWQDIAKINVLAAAGHSRLAIQDQAGKSTIMDESQLPPDIMPEIAFDAMMRIQGDNYLTQIPLPQIIPAEQEITALIQTAPATLSLTKEAAPNNKTITPHTWYMNATVVREANHNINETVAIFMLAPVFLLFFRDMAQGVVAAFGMAVCLIGRYTPHTIASTFTGISLATSGCVISRRRTKPRSRSIRLQTTNLALPGRQCAPANTSKFPPNGRHHPICSLPTNRVRNTASRKTNWAATKSSAKSPFTHKPCCAERLSPWKQKTRTPTQNGRPIFPYGFPFPSPLPLCWHYCSVCTVSALRYALLRCF